MLLTIKASFTQRSLSLHGVTSSGKTEAYIKLIEEYVRGEQVLYLLTGNCTYNAISG
jgi:primosomal protein N' (replication factor Y)